MIIVVNGGYRTGSTFIFSMVKEVFNFKNLLFESSVISQNEIEKIVDSKTEINQNRNYIFKSHNWLPRENEDINRVKTIYTRRHYLDVFSSFVKVGSASHLNYMEEILEEKRREKIMLGRESLILEYRDFYGNEGYALNKVASFLNIEIDKEKFDIEKMKIGNVKKITDKLKPGNKTLFVPNHVSSAPYPDNFIDTLDPEQIKNIVYEVRKKYYF